MRKRLIFLAWLNLLLIKGKFSFFFIYATIVTSESLTDRRFYSGRVPLDRTDFPLYRRPGMPEAIQVLLRCRWRDNCSKIPVMAKGWKFRRKFSPRKILEEFNLDNFALEKLGQKNWKMPRGRRGKL